MESSYFGHDEFARYAPGLRNIADGAVIRNKILAAFEQAEAEENPKMHKELQAHRQQNCDLDGGRERFPAR